jgi:hypothetical protein
MTVTLIKCRKQIWDHEINVATFTGNAQLNGRVIFNKANVNSEVRASIPSA